jgi:hypothetical protein
VGWIGPPKDDEELGQKIKKKINFQTNGIQILGIYFSHNKEYFRSQNLDRVFEKFKATLSIWKLRNLTLYGKVQVVRSLAISQLLYVMSTINVPPIYYKKVEDEIVNFIWSGKKTEIKYKSLIGNYSEGGLRLPDIQSMIQTSRVKWAIKLMEGIESEKNWKRLALYYMNKLGGVGVIGEHFQLPNNLKDKPEFYKEILQAWSEISETKIDNVENVMRQPIWSNKFIQIQVEPSLLRMHLFFLMESPLCQKYQSLSLNFNR